MATSIAEPALTQRDQPVRTEYGLWSGLGLVALIAASALVLAQTQWMTHNGISPLILSVLIGMVVGNTAIARFEDRLSAGIDLAKGRLLRIAIVLYGFRITFQAIAGVGWAGFLLDVAVVTIGLMIAVVVGCRLLGLDRQTALLIGAGSSFCGAAAVAAIEPVIKAPPHKVAIAVATVVMFGTIGMFLYPALYPYLGLSEHGYGLFVGATIHEVAQVVAAGNAIGTTAGDAAVIEKMMRVMMLAPFLLLIGRRERGAKTERRETSGIPWFAVLFVGVAGIHSTGWVPEALVDALTTADTVLLSMAMAALGLRTRLVAIRQAGMAPMILAATLWVFLLVGGFGLNAVVLMLP